MRDVHRDRLAKCVDSAPEIFPRALEDRIITRAHPDKHSKTRSDVHLLSKLEFQHLGLSKRIS